MRRSSRPSAVHNREDANLGAEDVTAILNAEAGSKGPTPSRKRARDSEPANSPDTCANKRISVHIPSRVSTPANHPQTATPATRASTRGLQKRPSLPAPPRSRVIRDDPFELPRETEEEAAPRPVLEPTKKLRVLKKATQPNPSPFKGKGMLRTVTNAQVYLDDSPRRRSARVRARFKNIGKSLVKPRGAPAEEEDILSAAYRDEEADPPTPELGIGLPPDSPAARKKAPKPSKTATPTKTGNKAAQGSTSAQAETEPVNRAQPTRAHNPLAQVAELTRHEERVPASAAADTPRRRSGRQKKKAAQAESPEVRAPLVHHVERSSPAGPDGGEARDQDEYQVEGDDGTQDDGEDAEAPQPTAPRPQTDAERKKDELAKAEEEARHQRRVKKALKGIEAAAQCHDCGDAWRDMLVAALKIVKIEERPEGGPTSTLGKAVERSLDDLIEAYKSVGRAEPPLSREERMKRVGKDLALLRERCKEVCSFDHRSDIPQGDLQRKLMIEDIYWHLIPHSLRLAKRALRALYGDEGLDVAVLGELLRILDVVRQLVRSATRWTPRPKLDGGVKPTTRAEIKPNVDVLIRQYLAAVNEDARKKHVETMAARSLANWNELMAQAQRRAAMVRTKHRMLAGNPDAAMNTPPPAPAPAPAPAVRPPLPTVDIDEGGVEDAQDQDGRDYTEDDRPSAAVSSRPPVKRELTEEIPPPAPGAWTDAENTVLLNALQKYTSESRFQDIVDAYGATGRKLGKYDLDEIVAHARWLKQSMARPLQTELDESWNWLRSVPD